MQVKGRYPPGGFGLVHTKQHKPKYFRLDLDVTLRQRQGPSMFPRQIEQY